MIALKFLVKFIKLLNSETSSNSLACAFALGMVLGLVPILTLQALVAILIALFFRVNLTALLGVGALFKLVALALAGPFDRMGVALLESKSLEGLWTFCYNSSVFAYCYLNNSIILSATITAGILLVPFFLLSRVLVGKYRSLLSQSQAVKAGKGLGLYRLYQRLDSPFR